MLNWHISKFKLQIFHPVNIVHNLNLQVCFGDDTDISSNISVNEPEPLFCACNLRYCLAVTELIKSSVGPWQ